MKFSERLRELRKSKGYTQEALAKTIGITPGAIGLYEQDRREPDNNTIITLAEVFGVSVDYLLGLDETPTSISHYNGQDNDITFDDFTFAMYEETKDLTDEQKEALLRMAKLLKNSK